MIKEAIAFLAKLQNGDIKTAAGEAEKAEEQPQIGDRKLPFPVSVPPGSRSDDGPGSTADSLEGLPFTQPEKSRLPFPSVPRGTKSEGKSLGS